MIALPRALGGFHIAQQGIHFGQTELTISTHYVWQAKVAKSSLPSSATRRV